MDKICLSLMAACLMVSPFTLSSAEDVKTKTPPVNLGPDDCSKDILLAYFPKVFVNETLKKFNVPQEKWEAINNDLSNKDKEILKDVEEKAAKMESNPLQDPQKHQIALKLFRETLLEKFGIVMKANGITDEKQIQEMLTDIQQRKTQRFAECIKKHRDENKSPSSSSDED